MRPSQLKAGAFDCKNFIFVHDLHESNDIALLPQNGK
nr:unnamed protein product [Callosobruchus analis]